MDTSSVCALVQLNKDFYRVNADAFSASRKRGWGGWQRILREIDHLPPDCRVLDVACGNLRFERFLLDALPDHAFDFTCLDACDELASSNMPGVKFTQADVIELLVSSKSLADGEYDVAVSFGFMHHVPTFDLRASLLRELLAQVSPGGIVAVSFWKFAEVESMAARARETTAEGCAQHSVVLDENDYLLGWDGIPGVYRYCHSFADAEIDQLLDAVKALGVVADRFSADGRNGALNEYVVLRRR